MKSVMKLATGTICILISQASNASAQVPVGYSGLNEYRSDYRAYRSGSDSNLNPLRY